MNQLGTPGSMWHSSAVLFPKPGWEFCLWSDFGKGLNQTPNFYVANLMHKLFYVFCKQFDRNEHF